MVNTASTSFLVNDFKFSSVGTLTLQIFEDFGQVEQIWRLLEVDGVCSAYQRFDWISEWTKRVARPARIKSQIVVGSVNNQVLFILPLGLRNRGPFTIASWLGDSHSNFHMGIFTRDFLRKAAPEQFRELIMHIIRSFGSVDVIELCCQPVIWGGCTNPFTYLDWQESHNQGFALQLNDDLKATLDRKNGARKRKKYRWQVNKLEPVGGATLRIASTEEDVDEFLNTAFTQLGHRFNKSGIWNRFEDDGVETFFRQLAKSSINRPEPVFEIFGLEIDGKLRAVFAGGIHHGEFSGCFISTAKDDFQFVSPGELIIYLVIEECVKRGYKSFDLGRGEERYKTSWCDTIIPMFETNIAITKLGMSYAGYERGKLAIKKLVRNNKTLWEVAKKVRAKLYGRL